jgi:ectoine hydroxylase-related dioxygenase (phytanoyl-CoA dioxygenase family)
MVSLLHNAYASLNNSLENLGYCTMDLLSADDIEVLLKVYKENKVKDARGFHPTMFHNNAEYRKKMNDTIIEVLSSRLEEYIGNDYKILYGNFMVKEPGEESNMKIHQDWTYVDETKYNSFAFWIPLCDLNSENGAFNVVPFSHLTQNLKRGPGTYCPIYEHRDVIEKKYSKPLYLKAGQAVCWNHRLAHFSPANISNTSRIAVTVIVVPKHAQTIHYYKSDNSKDLLHFEIDSDFFNNYKIGQQPDLPIISKEKYIPYFLSSNQLKSMLTSTFTKRIFKDSILNQKFEKKGFVVIDLLNSDEFTKLTELYYTLFNAYQNIKSNTNADYDLSFFRQSGEVKQKIFDSIWSFFKDHIETVLPEYEPLIINMFNKKPGTGEVPIHQNWTFVDEDEYTSVSVWVPLCDVSRKNGTLEVVPGTHMNVSKYRGPSIPWAFNGLEKVLKKKYMEPLNLTKGQVAILDDSIIHYSADNYSNKERPTIQLILKPKKAKAIHYHSKEINKGKLDVFEVDAQFFMHFNMSEQNINATLLKTINFTPPTIKEKDILEAIN